MARSLKSSRRPRPRRRPPTESVPVRMMEEQRRSRRRKLMSSLKLLPRLDDTQLIFIKVHIAVLANLG